MFKRKPNKDDGHNTGSDRYLITYADLITLLLGLFVVLYGSSQVDKEKYSEFSAAFSQYFKAKDGKVLQGGDGVLQGHRKSVPEPILSPVSQKSLVEISTDLDKSLKKFIENGTLNVSMNDSVLRINLSEKLLFRSGKAELEPEGIIALDSIANILKGLKQSVFIDGHTDSDPIRTFQFESNWHLSGARATNTAYRLIEGGLPEFNLTVRGYGSQRPIADNSTPEGKAINRRVEITLTGLSPNMPSDKGYIDKDSVK
jgi:chemotaxis protein MotB